MRPRLGSTPTDQLWPRELRPGRSVRVLLEDLQHSLAKPGARVVVVTAGRRVETKFRILEDGLIVDASSAPAVWPASGKESDQARKPVQVDQAKPGGQQSQGVEPPPNDEPPGSPTRSG
jgi:hypothetical protein